MLYEEEDQMKPINRLFKEQVKVINIGIPSFADDLKRQGFPVIHVDWRPPAGGNRKIQALLDKIKQWQTYRPRMV